MIVEFSADWFAISAGNLVLSQEPGNSARCRLKQPISSAFLWSTPQRSGFCGAATQVPCTFGDMICDPLRLGAIWPPAEAGVQPWSKELAPISSTIRLARLTLRKFMVGLQLGSRKSRDSRDNSAGVALQANCRFEPNSCSVRQQSLNSSIQSCTHSHKTCYMQNELILYESLWYYIADRWCLFRIYGRPGILWARGIVLAVSGYWSPDLHSQALWFGISWFGLWHSGSTWLEDMDMAWLCGCTCWTYVVFRCLLNRIPAQLVCRFLKRKLPESTLWEAANLRPPGENLWMWQTQ